ncbi:MAG: hypothetical protein RH859_12990 [Longimicrobiales bacterium]
MVRNVLAVVAGFVMVGVTVAGLQWLSASLYPLPAGLDPMDPADAGALAEHARGLPAGAWALAFGSELLGAFLGALVAGRVASSHHTWFALALVVLAAAASVMNWVAFPHPVWFMVGQAALYPVVFLGVRTFLSASAAADPAAAANGS